MQEEYNLLSEEDELLLDEESISQDESTDNETFERFHITVDPGQAPLRIDKFLITRLGGASRTKYQEAADAGYIFVNGKSVKSNYKVKPGDDISVQVTKKQEAFELIPEDIPLNIVYEDEAVLVVNKPAGLVVHPAFGHYTGTLVNALAWHLKDSPLFADKTNIRPGLVHRIDKDTSGLLVIAKTEEAKISLSRQFFHKTTDRKYIAVCWGDVEQNEGTIIGNIWRHAQNRKIMSVYPADGEIGKSAITHYKVLERLGYVNVVQCILETGRTHQIRAHFKHIKHPLFNDAEYGGNDILRGTTFAKYKQFVQNCFDTCPRQALHAKTLGFDHPVTGERMSFDSELPTDMQQLIEKWRTYIADR